MKYRIEWEGEVEIVDKKTGEIYREGKLLERIPKEVAWEYIHGFWHKGAKVGLTE